MTISAIAWGCSQATGGDQGIKADPAVKAAVPKAVDHESAPPAPAMSAFIDPVEEPIHAKGDRAPVVPIAPAPPAPPPPISSAPMIMGTSAAVVPVTPPPCTSGCPSKKLPPKTI